MRLIVVSALLCGALTAVLVWVWLRDWELAVLAAPIGIAFGTVIGAFAATSEKASPPAPRGPARSPRSPLAPVSSLAVPAVGRGAGRRRLGAPQPRGGATNSDCRVILKAFADALPFGEGQVLRKLQADGGGAPPCPGATSLWHGPARRSA